MKYLSGCKVVGFYFNIYLVPLVGDIAKTVYEFKTIIQISLVQKIPDILGEFFFIHNYATAVCMGCSDTVYCI